MCLSYALYRAIEDGEVTQIRLPVNSQHVPLSHEFEDIRFFKGSGFVGFHPRFKRVRLFPFFHPGEYIGIKEPFCPLGELGLFFLYDCPDAPLSWLKPQAMSSADCRLILSLRDVKAQRLSDAGADDALKEGITMLGSNYTSPDLKHTQPTAPAALAQWFIEKNGLPVKDYWTWVYSLTILNKRNYVKP